MKSPACARQFGDTPQNVCGNFQLGRQAVAGRKRQKRGGCAASRQRDAVAALSRSCALRPCAVIALTTDNSVLNGNREQYGYDRVFGLQVLYLGRRVDVLLVISTFGGSAARQMPRAVGVIGGDVTPRCDVCLQVLSHSTPLIQSVHIPAGHIIYRLVEERLFPLTL